MSEPFKKHEKVKIVVKGKPPFTSFVAAIWEDGHLLLHDKHYGTFYVTPVAKDDSGDENDGR